MRGHFLTAGLACVTLAMLVAASGRAQTQDENQSSPSSANQSAPEPPPSGQGPAVAKKAGAKKDRSALPDAPSAADPNRSFSGASSSGVSSEPKPAASRPSEQENPFPEAVSQSAARPQENSSAGQTTEPPQQPKDDPQNPFPEDVSHGAATQDGGNSPNSPKGAGSPSADGQGLGGGSKQDGLKNAPKLPEVPDPARAKKDDQVANFYLQTGDYRGAYLRYQDALRSEPTDVDAIFGIAESARALKLTDEAERNYKLYLDIVPDGKRAKQAVKALHSLEIDK